MTTALTALEITVTDDDVTIVPMRYDGYFWQSDMSQREEAAARDIVHAARLAVAGVSPLRELSRIQRWMLADRIAAGCTARGVALTGGRVRLA